jgi:hypothetical protein
LAPNASVRARPVTELALAERPQGVTGPQVELILNPQAAERLEKTQSKDRPESGTGQGAGSAYRIAQKAHPAQDFGQGARIFLPFTAVTVEVGGSFLAATQLPYLSPNRRIIPHLENDFSTKRRRSLA